MLGGHWYKVNDVWGKYIGPNTFENGTIAFYRNVGFVIAQESQGLSYVAAKV